jgi:hypothetical protein
VDVDGKVRCPADGEVFTHFSGAIADLQAGTMTAFIDDILRTGRDH